MIEIQGTFVKLYSCNQLQINKIFRCFSFYRHLIKLLFKILLYNFTSFFGQVVGVPSCLWGTLQTKRDWLINILIWMRGFFILMRENQLNLHRRNPLFFSVYCIFSRMQLLGCMTSKLNKEWKFRSTKKMKFSIN